MAGSAVTLKRIPSLQSYCTLSKANTQLEQTHVWEQVEQVDSVTKASMACIPSHQGYRTDTQNDHKNDNNNLQSIA